MTRMVISLIAGTIFLGISTVLIYFGANYLAGNEIGWNASLGYALVVRFFFVINDVYRQIEKELGI